MYIFCIFSFFFVLLSNNKIKDAGTRNKLLYYMGQKQTKRWTNPPKKETAGPKCVQHGSVIALVTIKNKKKDSDNTGVRAARLGIGGVFSGARGLSQFTGGVYKKISKKTRAIW